MLENFFKFVRFKAIFYKEVISISRDKRTYACVIILPLLNIILFGYIMSSDPKHLATIVIDNNKTQFSRELITEFTKTGYFNISAGDANEVAAEQALNAGQAVFVLNIPSDFSKRLVRGLQPHILLESDASNPTAIYNALQAANTVVNTVYPQHFIKHVPPAADVSAGIKLDIHTKFNAELNPEYYTVPGLVMYVLTVSLLLSTAVSIAGEKEHGTIETILITPTKAIEIILGKIFPHLILGYITINLAFLLSHFLFKVPFIGSWLLLSLASLFFILSSSAAGLIISLIARNQLQAAYIAGAYSMPAILFSGFIFPFQGMPPWAQNVGNIFPQAHFNRLLSNIMLKAATLSEAWPDIWPIIIFIIVCLLSAIFIFAKTWE